MNESKIRQLDESLTFYEGILKERIPPEGREKLANYLRRASSMTLQYGLIRSLLFIMSKVNREILKNLTGEMGKGQKKKVGDTEEGLWAMVFLFTNTILSREYGWGKQFGINLLRNLLDARETLYLISESLVSHYDTLAKIIESEVGWNLQKS